MGFSSSLAAAGIGIALFCAPPAFAQTPHTLTIRTAESEALLDSAFTQMMNFQLAIAERNLRLLARRPDGGAAAFQHLTLVSLLKVLISEQPAHGEEFFQRADSLREEIRHLADELHRTWVEAEIDLMRALVYARQERYVRSALVARLAYRKFEKLMQQDTSFYDGYAGLGLLHLAVGSLPSPYRRLLRLFGYKGSVRQGAEELQAVCKLGTYRQEFALVTLALADALLYRDPEAGLKKIHGFYERHPESTLAGYLLGFMLMQNRRAAEAQAVLAAAAAWQDAPGSSYFRIPFVDHYLGKAFLLQNRFAEAEMHFRLYLTRQEGPALKASTWHLLGIAVELQGRRPESLEYYRAVAGRRDFDGDRAAYRSARHRLEQPLVGLEKKLLLGANLYDGGAPEQAEPLLRQVFHDPSATEAERAEAAYRLGRVQQSLGHRTEALQSYLFAAEHPGDEAARWKPWSLYYMGRIHAEMGEQQKAAERYLEALACKGQYDYDYAQALEQNARAALEQLGTK